MGCTSSKQARRDRRRSPSAAVARCRSLPPSGQHVVALTASTLGSLKLEAAGGDEEMMKTSNDHLGLSPELATAAKAWSEMIEKKIPKTPTVTPPNEPETINAWELMAGLEDTTPPRSCAGATDAERSFSFHSSSPKPMWMVLAGEEDSIIADFDPEMISAFRKAFKSFSSEPETITGIVKARVTEFQERIDAKKDEKMLSNNQEKVVLYFTSLRGVRKTYEDCANVRMILKGYGVEVDERDVSMHGGFKEELNEILGGGFEGRMLPRVFVNGSYIGGVEEVRQLHDAGDLWEILRGCRKVVEEKGQCETCFDVRFVPCETCSGSCKVFVEDEEDEEMEVVSGFRRCFDCNENGLVRCPLCCC
ncbi:putative glutaredoxin, Thioredoxin-like superfamily [Dioscorea sansibarensis]